MDERQPRLRIVVVESQDFQGQPREAAAERRHHQDDALLLLGVEAKPGRHDHRTSAELLESAPHRFDGRGHGQGAADVVRGKIEERRPVH